MSGLARSLFDLHGRGTTPAREVRGGITTFLTMVYILFANPSILASAGIPFEAAVAATAAAAAICTLLMGLGANFPIALAPGMGLNAVVAFQVAGQTGSWQAAMGLVVLNGLVVLALVLVGVREAVMRAIPLDLRRAISVGIGLFIALIGAVNARLVVVPPSSMAALGSGSAGDGSACHLRVAARARAPDRARGSADHRVPALEKGAWRDRHRHRERHRRGTAPRRVALASRRLATDAAVRHGLPGGSAERVRHPLTAVAALDRDGRLLRHDRHGHRDR